VAVVEVQAAVLALERRGLSWLPPSDSGIGVRKAKESRITSRIKIRKRKRITSRIKIRIAVGCGRKSYSYSYSCS
jgi:hypothetical protein